MSGWYRRVFGSDSQEPWKWQELADFLGVGHIPYNISVMSIFEQYAAAIPLFFPDLDFMKILYERYRDKGVLSQLSWNQVREIQPVSVIGASTDGDPNKYDDTSMVMNWVRLADYYDTETMPYLTYFSSFDHLKELLLTVDLQDISNKMEQFGKKRRNSIMSRWENLLKIIQRF